MPVRVITPPDPLVLPSDIAGSHAADDPAVAAMIQAVTEEIDGPTGWLARALGPQTLELSLSCWGDRSIRLPFPPVIEIDAVTYLDADGVEQTVDPTGYGRSENLLWFRPTWSEPRLACEPWPIKVQYQAGYNGDDTGAVPERARQAIILSVQQMKSTAGENLFLRSVEVPDVLTRQYTVSDQAGEIIHKICERLLSGLRVYS